MRSAGLPQAVLTCSGASYSTRFLWWATILRMVAFAASKSRSSGNRLATQQKGIYMKQIRIVGTFSAIPDVFQNPT